MIPMYKNITYILPLLTLVFPLIAIGQFSVMTYNIRYDNSQDNENAWDNRKEELAQLVTFYSPDILGIQEGLYSQVKYLDSVLNEYNYVGNGRDDGLLKGEFTAIFYKTKRVKMLYSKSYWLSETPDRVSVGWDASMERITTFAILMDKQTKDVLYVFNAHFDHIGEVARENSAKVILNIINEKMLDDKKVIVMGDFNCEAKDKPIISLKTMLEDPFDIHSVIKYGPLGTFNHFNIVNPITKRIDYILTKNILVKKYIHLDDKRKNNFHLSDHLPVMIHVD
ncbi:MAG: endonuclease/exonuclease/phosphatase family protein [Saprospiraceae bacterium]